MKRSAPIRRGKPPARSRKPIARSPIKRKAKKPSKFALQYHSKARIEFIASFGCAARSIFCSGRIENAHTERRAGMGLKGNYRSCVPLCHFHHQRLHNVGRETFEAAHAIDLAQRAVIFEALWIAHAGKDAA